MSWIVSFLTDHPVLPVAAITFVFLATVGGFVLAQIDRTLPKPFDDFSYASASLTVIVGLIAGYGGGLTERAGVAFLEIVDAVGFDNWFSRLVAAIGVVFAVGLVAVVPALLLLLLIHFLVRRFLGPLSTQLIFLSVMVGGAYFSNSLPYIADYLPKTIFLIVAVAAILACLAAAWLSKLLARRLTRRADGIALPDLEREGDSGAWRFRFVLFMLLVTSVIALFYNDNLTTIGSVVALALATLMAVPLAARFAPRPVMRIWITVGPRVRGVSRYMGEHFWSGAPLVISVIVVAMAILKLLDVSYISDLFRLNQQATNWFTIKFVISSYLFCFFVSLWVRRVFFSEVMQALRPRGQPPRPESKKHLVIGKLGGKPIYLTFRGVSGFRTECDARIVTNLPTARVLGCLGGLAGGKDLDRMFYRLYLPVLDAVVIGLLIAFLWPAKYAAAIVAEGTSAGHFDLETVLAEPADNAEVPPRQLFALAASGGGSRAMLHTYAVLRGLQALELADQLVLISSVSGGSAAAAYFAINRERLIADEPEAGAWDCFRAVVQKPFIQDAIDDLSLLSVYYWMYGRERPPLITRLAASFERTFHDHREMYFSTGNELEDCEGSEGSRTTYRDITELGLLTNTTLVGRVGGDRLLQGSRLVFTNVKQEFSRWPEGVRRSGYGLHYEAVRDPDVNISDAAALSGNFPPVFRDATVEVEVPVTESDASPPALPDAAIVIRKNEYAVTDGGVTDNRGIDTLFAVLETALEAKCDSICRASLVTEFPRTHTELHVLVADASQSASAYEVGRGIGAVLSGSTKLADEFIDAKWQDLENLARRQGIRLYLHNLRMPYVFHADGGLGTHWMLPSSAVFESADENVDNRKISQRDFVAAIEEASLVEPSGESDEREFLRTEICRDVNARYPVILSGLVSAARGGPYSYCEGHDRLLTIKSSVGGDVVGTLSCPGGDGATCRFRHGLDAGTFMSRPWPGYREAGMKWSDTTGAPVLCAKKQTEKQTDCDVLEAGSVYASLDGDVTIEAAFEPVAGRLLLSAVGATRATVTAKLGSAECTASRVKACELDVARDVAQDTNVVLSVAGSDPLREIVLWHITSPIDGDKPCAPAALSCQFKWTGEQTITVHFMPSTFYFDSNVHESSYALDADELAFYQSLITSDDAASWIVIGYSDELGDENENCVLSSDRADAVAALFDLRSKVAAGIDRTQCADGAGDACRRAKRRAVIRTNTAEALPKICSAG